MSMENYAIEVLNSELGLIELRIKKFTESITLVGGSKREPSELVEYYEQKKLMFERKKEELLNAIEMLEHA